MANGSQNMTTDKARQAFYLDAPNEYGYSTDQYGNFIYKYVPDPDNPATGYFHLDNNAKTISLRYYWDSGDVWVPGKVGIGYNPTTSSNTYSLYVNGTSYFTNTAYFGNGTTYYISADGSQYSGNAATATALTSDAGGTEQPIYFTGGKPSATSYALKATVNNSTANYMAYYDGARSLTGTSYIRLTSQGTLSIFPVGGSYRDGIRIHARTADNEWAAILLCGSDNTGDSGTSANSWFLGATSGNLYFGRNGTGGSGTYLRCVNNVWEWNGTANGSISGNAATATKATQDSDGNAINSTYLKLSGGTMTGNLSFSNSGTAFRGINYGTMGDNDQWRIGGAATAANAGYMELATADDGNEPIYVRQYTGVFTTVKRTLTLLDANGYTTLPNRLYFETASDGIYYKGTKATHRAIRFIDNTSGTDGNGVIIGAAGYVGIGSGESGDQTYSGAGYSAGSEVLALSSDGDIRLLPNQQNGYNVVSETLITTSGLWVGVAGNTTREMDIGVRSGAGTMYMWAAASTSGDRGIWLPAHGSGGAKSVFTVNTNNAVTFYGTLSGNASSATYASSYLASRGSVSGSDHAAALKAWFDANKSTEPRDALVAHYSSAHSNGSLCMGYFLSGYNSNPYGGFFVCHYDTPRYVGISNGTYNQHTIVTDRNRDSWTFLPRSHTHDISQVTWAAGSNLVCNGANTEWSIDMASNATGSYWHVWSGIKGASCLICYNDDRRVNIPVRLDTAWLRVVNDSSNNSDDALVYLRARTSNDWVLKVDSNGANCGIYVDALDQGNAIQTNGYIRCRILLADQGSNGERQIGVDSSTAGRLYLWSNTGEKGIYSSTGYRTGYIIRITSSATTFYGDCTGNAATATRASTVGDGTTNAGISSIGLISKVSWSTSATSARSAVHHIVMFNQSLASVWVCGTNDIYVTIREGTGWVQHSSGSGSVNVSTWGATFYRTNGSSSNYLSVKTNNGSNASITIISF